MIGFLPDISEAYPKLTHDQLRAAYAASKSDHVRRRAEAQRKMGPALPSAGGAPPWAMGEPGAPAGMPKPRRIVPVTKASDLTRIANSINTRKTREERGPRASRTEARARLDKARAAVDAAVARLNKHKSDVGIWGDQAPAEVRAATQGYEAALEAARVRYQHEREQLGEEYPDLAGPDEPTMDEALGMPDAIVPGDADLRRSLLGKPPVESFRPKNPVRTGGTTETLYRETTYRGLPPETKR
jgi:hypothetical protein